MLLSAIYVSFYLGSILRLTLYLMNRARLLIVEDEVIVAADLQLRLAQMGYQVAGATPSGEAALALAEQIQHRVDR